MIEKKEMIKEMRRRDGDWKAVMLKRNAGRQRFNKRD